MTPGGEFAGRFTGPSPQQLSAEPARAEKGRLMTWGGTIVSISNLADRTVLEVLAYPLDRSGRPDTGAAPQGRFLADRNGFLEPRDYRTGRVVTVRGPLLGFKDGQIGDASYRFPAIAADALKLWSTSERWRKPRVGVSIGTGSYGSGVGVGVGF